MLEMPNHGTPTVCSFRATPRSATFTFVRGLTELHRDFRVSWLGRVPLRWPAAGNYRVRGKVIVQVRLIEPKNEVD